MDLDMGDDRVDCIGLSMGLSRGASGGGSSTGRACTLRERNGDNSFLSLPGCSLAFVFRYASYPTRTSGRTGIPCAQPRERRHDNFPGLSNREA